MKYLYILFCLVSQIAFAQLPMPHFPCYEHKYRSTNEYGIDFTKYGWAEQLTDSMDLNTMKIGVSTLEGKTVLLPIYDRIVLLTDLKDSCLVEIPYAVVMLNEEQFVMNLETGERTKPHKSILYDDNLFFYRDLKTWGVYDLDFHFIVKDLPGVSGTNGDPSDPDVCETCSPEGFSYTNSFTLEFKNNLQAKGITIDFPKVVLYRVRNEPTTEKELLKMEKWQQKHPTEPWDKNKLGLVDLSSGKKITPRFDEVQAKLLNDQIYYWCYTYSWKYPFEKTHDLVIYDKHLKEVFHYENEYLPRSNLETDIPIPSENMELYNQLRYFEPRENVYFIKDKAGKLGAVNANGTLVVPFVYDSISYLGESEKYIYKVWTDGQFHWLTNGGTRLMMDGVEAVTKRDVSGKIQYFMRSAESVYSWYAVDPLTNERTGPFDEFYSVYWPGDPEQNQFLEFNLRGVGYYSYLVRKVNELFYSLDNEFHRIDSTTYLFRNETILLHNMIITKLGEIRYKTSVLQRLNESGYVEYSTDRMPVKFFHVDGVRVLELEDAIGFSKLNDISDVRVIFKGGQTRNFNTLTWEWQK